MMVVLWVRSIWWWDSIDVDSLGSIDLVVVGFDRILDIIDIATKVEIESDFGAGKLDRKASR